MTRYVLIFSLWAGVECNAMEQKQPRVACFDSPLTQIAQRPLEEIKITYPNAQSILRDTTIADLSATVKILNMIQASKEEIIGILDKMEGALYKATGLNQPVFLYDAFNTLDNIQDVSDCVGSYLKYVNKIIVSETQSYDMFAMYMTILNLQYYYGHRRASYVIHFIASFMHSENEKYTHMTDSRTSHPYRGNHDPGLNHQKKMALLDTAHKKQGAYILRYEYYAHTKNQRTGHQGDRPDVEYNNASYAQYLDNLTLFFEDCDAIERYENNKIGCL